MMLKTFSSLFPVRGRLSGLLAALTALFMLPAQVLAQTDSAQGAQVAQGAGAQSTQGVQASDAVLAVGASTGWGQMISGLLVVIVVLIGGLYLLKRLTAPSGASALLKVIAAVGVGTRERVVVVEVDQTWLVLGVTAGQVNKLHEMPRQALTQGKPPAGSDGMAMAHAAQTSGAAGTGNKSWQGSFADRLRQVTERSHQPKQHEQDANNAPR